MTQVREEWDETRGPFIIDFVEDMYIPISDGEVWCMQAIRAYVQSTRTEHNKDNTWKIIW
jgi:hypothetical protein